MIAGSLNRDVVQDHLEPLIATLERIPAANASAGVNDLSMQDWILA